MTKRILWISHHNPVESQILALRRMFGEDTVVERESRPFDDARQIARRYHDSDYDDLIVVAPLSVLKTLCQQGIKPLWAEAAEENDPARIEFRGSRGQGFRFERFRRIKDVRVVFEDE